MRIGAKIAVAQIERLTGRLREVAGDSEQKIGVRVAGLCPIDVEGPVEGGVGMLIHLVDMKLSADLQSVRADDFREPIAQIVRVVDLRHVGDRNAHDEGGKRNILHAFKLRRLHIRSPAPRAPVAKPCEARLTPRPPFGCPMILALRR